MARITSPQVRPAASAGALQNAPAISVPVLAGAMLPGTGLPPPLGRHRPLLLIPPPNCPAVWCSCCSCCCGDSSELAALDELLATAMPRKAGWPIRIEALPCPAAIWWAIVSAWLIGIEKPSLEPREPNDWVFAAVFMPITCPAAFASGPPESPSAICALVWSMLCSVSLAPEPASLAVIVRWSAVIDPLVTVGFPFTPPALPSATTGEPRVTLDESPTWTVFSPDTPVSLSSATSSVASVPTISARYLRPVVTTVAVSPVEPSTTWLLVSTSPDELSTIPVPSNTWPVKRRVAVMSTNPGSTLPATACSSMPEVLVLPLPGLPDGDGMSWGEKLLLLWGGDFACRANTAPAPSAAATIATST